MGFERIATHFTDLPGFSQIYTGFPLVFFKNSFCFVFVLFGEGKSRLTGRKSEFSKSNMQENT